MQRGKSLHGKSKTDRRLENTNLLQVNHPLPNDAQLSSLRDVFSLAGRTWSWVLLQAPEDPCNGLFFFFFTVRASDQDAFQPNEQRGGSDALSPHSCFSLPAAVGARLSSAALPQSLSELWVTVGWSKHTHGGANMRTLSAVFVLVSMWKMSTCEVSLMRSLYKWNQPDSPLPVVSHTRCHTPSVTRHLRGRKRTHVICLDHDCSDKYFFLLSLKKALIKLWFFLKLLN